MSVAPSGLFASSSVVKVVWSLFQTRFAPVARIFTMSVLVPTPVL